MSHTFHHNNAERRHQARLAPRDVPEFFVKRMLTPQIDWGAEKCRCQEISFDVRYCPLHGHLFNREEA